MAEGWGGMGWDGVGWLRDGMGWDGMAARVRNPHREHRRARAAAGQRVALQRVQILDINQSRAVRADPLHDRSGIQPSRIAVAVAGEGSPAEETQADLSRARCAMRRHATQSR